MRKFLALLIFIFISASPAIADITPPWSTTFDCDCDGNAGNGDTDWLTYSDTLICDGVSKGGNWTTAAGNYDEIVPAANMAAGGGGKGFRHWVGDAAENDNGGSIALSFSSSQTELWIRWYHRWALDFAWSSLVYDKLLYFDMGLDGSVIPEPTGFDKFTFRLYTGTQDYDSVSGTGWDAIMSAGSLDGNGHRQSDGLWHCFEVHIKQESAPGNSDAELALWHNGSLVMSESGFQFGDSTGWDSVTLNSNQRYVDNGGVDMPVDMDDVAVSNTGYIGPLGSTPAEPAAGTLSQGGNSTIANGNSSITIGE